MSQKGFSVIEVSLVIVVIAIVGAVGYMAYTNFNAKGDSTSTPHASTKPSPTPGTVTITDTNGLSNADKSLDDTQLDDTDASVLDQATNDL